MGDEARTRRPKPWAEENIKLSKHQNKQICTSIFIRETMPGGPNVPNTIVELIQVARRPVSTPESERQSISTEVVSLNIPVVFNAWKE